MSPAMNQRNEAKAKLLYDAIIQQRQLILRHRGGERATLAASARRSTNALPVKGCAALTGFMREFQAANPAKAKA